MSSAGTTGRHRSAAPLRVLLADADRLLLEGVKHVLEDSDDFEVVGEAHTLRRALALLERSDPDVVLLDVPMPGADALVALDEIRRRRPATTIVVLSHSAEPEHIRTLLRRGATGYIVKSIEPRDLPAAVRQVVEGTVFHAVGATRDESIAKEAGLTDREIVILRAVARGLSNQAIAREVWVTEQTVKFHLTNIYRKLNVSNRTEAARFAYQHGLLPPS